MILFLGFIFYKKILNYPTSEVFDKSHCEKVKMFLRKAEE